MDNLNMGVEKNTSEQNESIINKITQIAIEEGDRIAKDKSMKGYKDIASLRSSLGV